jgi:glycosyltransferase involved in cell wall biosynthesis
MGKSILVIGHAFVIDSNRSVWRKLGLTDNYDVDLLTPKKWTSNLVGEVEADDSTTIGLENIYTIDTYFRGSGSFYFYKLFKTFKIFNSKKYHSIIINQESWSFSLFFINLICFFTKNKNTFKYLMIAQNLKKKKLRWLIPFEKLNLRFVHRVLGCCRETKDVLVWKGIATPWIYFPLFYSQDLRPVPKLESSSIVLGYLGRLSEEKGLDTLLSAFDDLKKENQIELVIAGAGPLANNLTQEGIEFMGVIPHQDVQKFYSKIDVFVLPSLTRSFWKEQFGRVIVESVACGKFVIGSNSGAIPEVMKHLDLDYIFQEGNVESLKEQLTRFINDYKSLDITRHQSINETLFSEKAFVQRLIGIINE